MIVGQKGLVDLKANTCSCHGMVILKKVAIKSDAITRCFLTFGWYKDLITRHGNKDCGNEKYTSFIVIARFIKSRLD